MACIDVQDSGLNIGLSLGHDLVMASLKQIAESLLANGFEPPEGCVVAAVFDSATAAHEAGLAILAMGEAYWLLPFDERFIVCVSESRGRVVAKELEVMAGLGGRSKEALSSHREYRFGIVSFLIYGIVLIACFVWQSTESISVLGRVDSVGMFESWELWRAITALTLHADVVHLVSNLVAGLGFSFLVARLFGAALGWSMIFVSGFLGNLINALIHYPDIHYSIGASTAVFGALGIVTGFSLWCACRAPRERWMLPAWFLPALGGLTLLGILGVGEEPVDVGAHFSGFLCGVLLGFLGAFLDKWVAQVVDIKLWCGMLPLVGTAAAWFLALTFGV